MQCATDSQLKYAETDVLEIAYRDDGAADGRPVLLLHGFPYDIHAYDEVIALLAAARCRVITPYLRGYGPTRFLSAQTPRSGQQAALAHDALALMEALGITRAVVAGYDWGGRAACILAALWPQRVSGLVADGYTIQNIGAAGEPAEPDAECRYWYQYYFHGERGRAGLARQRQEFCKLLWKMWSPSWPRDDTTFARTGAAFENPDFVDVVIHSYRHRFGLAPGDPAYQATEALLAVQPRIAVPAVILQGADDGVAPPLDASVDRPYFLGRYDSRVLPKIGHNLPQEAPQAFADAILSLLS